VLYSMRPSSILPRKAHLKRESKKLPTDVWQM
jgi:hypothetical protein